MIRHSVMALRRPIAVDILAALSILLFLASQAPATEFFGEQEADGVRVVDGSGADVNVLTGNPFGSRPDFCPWGSYYFNELESDKAQLVLTDCATDDGTYPVQVLSN